MSPLFVLVAAAASFSGPTEIAVATEDVVVAWKNVDTAAITVTRVSVEDAATLQVVPPRLPKVVEPGKSLKFLVVAAGSTRSGYVTVESSAGTERLWVNVARSTGAPVIGGGGAATAGSRPSGSGPMSPVDLGGPTERPSPDAGDASMGRPEEDLRVTAGLDRGLVERALGAAWPRVEACGTARRERFTLAFGVLADGSVNGARVADGDGAAAACVTGVVSGLRFPEGVGTGDVTWTVAVGR